MSHFGPAPTPEEIADRWRRMDGPFTERELRLQADLFTLLWEYDLTPRREVSRMDREELAWGGGVLRR